MPLLHNGEDKNPKKKTCKYRMFFYLQCGRGFNCLYGGRTKNVLHVVFFCVVICKTVSVHTNRHVTLDTFEITVRFTPLVKHMRHRLFVRLRPDQCLLWLVSSLPILVLLGAHHFPHVSRLRVKENAPSVHTELRRSTLHCWIVH